MNKEPILINGAAVSGAVVAVIGLLAAFGVPISDTQTQAILGVTSAVVVPVGTWLLARRKTVTVTKAEDVARESAAANRPDPKGRLA